MKFLWGSATSAHQVEGGNNNDWASWNDGSGIAADHYHRFEEDFNLAQSLNQNAHRISIEWSRIEPAENKFDTLEITHYKKVIEALRSRNIEPFVTLWHWTLPIWIHQKGGWTNEETTKHFVNFTEKIGIEFKDEIRFFVTLNEPELYCIRSFIRGIGPAGRYKGIKSYFGALKNLIEAHINSFKILKSINPDFQIGISSNNIFFEAHKELLINRVLKKMADWWINEYFLNQIKNYGDFIGVNYYFHNLINWGFNKNKNEKTSDIGWMLYPEGIYSVLLNLKKYQKPIFITEHGLADKKDEQRAWFIKEIIENINRAKNDGADIRGYFHWSLIDNFEWEKGFEPRFGLVEINYETLERKVRPSAYEYAKIILNSKL